MIKYNLKCISKNCDKKEPFDGWFDNIDSFEKQKKLGFLTCPYCGSTEIIKNLMSPSIKSSKKSNKKLINERQNHNQTSKDLINKKHITEGTLNDTITILRSLKKEIENKAENVGSKFVKEARAIKSGKAKDRPIYGTAKPEKIEELKDEGIEVSSIPWVQDDH